jgi:chemotaxis signal transduction protein
VRQRIDWQPPLTAAESDRERMEAVWRQRAVRLSRRPIAAGASEDALLVLVVGLGEERYGIELPEVAEVLPPVEITPVPGAPTLLSGVIHVHGEIRPVVDLRRLLGIEAVENDKFPRVILLRRQGREMGLKVDSVEKIRGVTSGELHSAGDGYTTQPGRYITAFTKDSLMLLSTEALFAELGKETQS